MQEKFKNKANRDRAHTLPQVPQQAKHAKHITSYQP